MNNFERRQDAELTPPIDISATEEGVRVDLDMPGAVKDSLSITVENDVLTVGADRVALPENLRVLRRETRRGAYRRSFHLSRDLSREDITADYRSGVLTLNIPRAEHTIPRRIEVSVES